jgi:parvulin-like peptidyl-prolyl isomerase
MRRPLGAILVVALLSGGCQNRPKPNDVLLQPDEQFAATRPAGATGGAPASAPASRPVAARVATTEPYRLVATPTLISAGMLQINDQFVSLPTILDPIKDDLRAAARKAASEIEFRKEAMGIIRREIDGRIQHVLLLAEAEKRFADEDKKAVDEEVAKNLREGVARNEGSRSLLDQRLRQQGSSLEKWLKELREAVTIQQYLRGRVQPKVAVTRAMMWENYVANADKYRSVDSLQVQIIAEPFADFVAGPRRPSMTEALAATCQAWDLINRAAAALAEGKDFALVARSFSRDSMAEAGGTWPMMEKGSFRSPEVEKAALEQQDGAVSGIIETTDGYFIVKTLARQEGKATSFEDAQKEIEENIHRQQYRLLVGEHVGKLREQATVVEGLQFEKLALDEAARQFYRNEKKD